MTTASRLHVACPAISRFCESRPSPTSRRDEKIRSIARSVQEIIESEEEHDSSVNTSRDSVRSPFILVESPFTQRRCSSLCSPLASRKPMSNKLTRGLSDPDIHRPSLSIQSLCPKLQEDTLGLQPIPEVTSPTTPVSSTAEMNDVKQKCIT